MLPKHEKERIASFVIHERKKQRKEEKKFLMFGGRKKIPIGIYLLKKHSLDGLPSKKNNYLIVYFLPSSFSYTRGLKVVNFLAVLKETKFFISSNIH
jgi:hypothetical protein